jgi:hypothetical protein
VTVTDFSGIDGVGGVSGLLTDPDPRYFSRQLDGQALAAHSSFTGELTGFLDDLRRDLALHNDGTTAEVLLHIWVTDNEGAAHAINSGRCSQDGGVELLEEIFPIATALRRTLLAVWVPRADNVLADNLSHLAASLNVRSVEGALSDLPAGVHCADYIRHGGGDPGEACVRYFRGGY